MRESGNGRGRPCSLPRRIEALPWPSTVPSGGEMLAEMISKQGQLVRVVIYSHVPISSQ